MSIDHGKVLTKLLELASQLERNANIDFNNPHFTQGRREAYRDSANQIRALVQPAEAVACPVCNGNDGDAPCLYPSEGMVGCLRDKRLARDAAQGAVARVAWRSDPDQGTYLVAEWLGPLPEPGELLYTHPQAAPAQGDWKIPISWADFWIDKGNWQRANDYEAFDAANQWLNANLAAAPTQEGES